MSQPKPPPRLSDPASGAPEGVRAVLRAGQRELPGAADLARLASRLPLATPPASPPPSPAPIAAGAGGSLIPSALTGAALAVAVVLGYAWRTGEPGSAPAAPPIASIAASPSGAPIASIASAPVAASAIAIAPASPSAAPSAPVTASAIASAAPIASITSASASAPIAEAPPPLGAPIGGGAIAPVAEESEVALLQRAQDALGADPARALSLTADHARRFPGGALAQERELIAIDALVRAGQRAAARERAARFFQAFPRSAHRRRIENLVGADPDQKNDAPAPPTP